MKLSLLKFINNIDNRYLKSVTLLILLPIIWILSIPKPKLRHVIYILIALIIILLTPVAIYNYYRWTYMNSIVNGYVFFGSDRMKTDKVKYIVIHHDDIETTNPVQLRDIDAFHRYIKYVKRVNGNEVKLEGRGWESGFGYTYYVNDTAIFQMHRDLEYSVHAGRVNECSISICLHGDYSKEKISNQTLFRLIILVRYLQDKYNVPSSNVIGHRDVEGQETECPGRFIDLIKLRKFLKN